MALDTIIDGATHWVLAPLLPSERIYIGYLGLSVLIALAVHAWYNLASTGPKPDGIDQKGPLAWIFDPAVFLHPSSRQDVGWFLTNAIVTGGVLGQLVLTFDVLVALFHPALLSWVPEPLIAEGFATKVAYTIGAVLIFDIVVFCIHTLQHRVPVLWEFHKVHHSAEVLTPLTLFRQHPVDTLFVAMVATVLGAGLFATLLALTGTTPTAYELAGVNVLFVAFYVLGYNLRHSHVWLAYPAWLSHVFMSPAQHQIHHSSEERHWDKNMGFILSIWDWMAGSLYVPDHYEKLTYGVYGGQGEPLNPFATVGAMYLQPVRRAWEVLTAEDGRRPRRQRQLGAGLLVLTLLGGLGLLKRWDLDAARPDYPSVHVEELTWTEVHDALAKGWDTLIIPTGGTEQNGPLVPLGKHNLVVRHTSGAIARALGHTLVAPVIAHVPEGALGPEPTEHMAYAGTLTLPEVQFEAVLEWTARSYRQHGFKHILFIGDSGGNQAGQARVAQRLSAEWAADDITVRHIGDYYANNGQLEYLLSLGYTEGQIGTHAGIRDTSELLFVAPGAVRAVGDAIAPRNVRDHGLNGDHTKASAAIGKKMIALKVEAALAEIRRVDEIQALHAELE